MYNILTAHTNYTQLHITCLYEITFSHGKCTKMIFPLVSSIRVKTKLPNSEQSSKGKVKTDKFINRQNSSYMVL
jgi:hypothetical protein